MAGRCRVAAAAHATARASPASVRRTCRVDVWPFGELPAKSVWDAASALPGTEPLAGVLAADVDAARTPPSPRFTPHAALVVEAVTASTAVRRQCGRARRPRSASCVCTRHLPQRRAPRPDRPADGRGAEVEDGGAISSLEIAPPAEAAPLQELLIRCVPNLTLTLTLIRRGCPLRRATDQVRVPNPHPQPHPHPHPTAPRAARSGARAHLTLTLTLTPLPTRRACAPSRSCCTGRTRCPPLAYIRPGTANGNGECYHEHHQYRHQYHRRWRRWRCRRHRRARQRALDLSWLRYRAEAIAEPMLPSVRTALTLPRPLSAPLAGQWLVRRATR